jgi:hypothetical protein
LGLCSEPDRVVDVEASKVVDTQKTADSYEGIHFEFIVTAQEIHWVVSRDNWRQKETIDDYFKKVADIVGDVEVFTV